MVVSSSIRFLLSSPSFLPSFAAKFTESVSRTSLALSSYRVSRITGNRLRIWSPSFKNELRARKEEERRVSFVALFSSPPSSSRRSSDSRHERKDASKARHPSEKDGRYPRRTMQQKQSKQPKKRKRERGESNRTRNERRRETRECRGSKGSSDLVTKVGG